MLILSALGGIRACVVLKGFMPKKPDIISTSMCRQFGNVRYGFADDWKVCMWVIHC
jgi:hypothetical protein